MWLIRRSSITAKQIFVRHAYAADVYCTMRCVGGALRCFQLELEVCRLFCWSLHAICIVSQQQTMIAPLNLRFCFIWAYSPRYVFGIRMTHSWFTFWKTRRASTFVCWISDARKFLNINENDHIVLVRRCRSFLVHEVGWFSIIYQPLLGNRKRHQICLLL